MNKGTLVHKHIKQQSATEKQRSELYWQRHSWSNTCTGTHRHSHRHKEGNTVVLIYKGTNTDEEIYTDAQTKERMKYSGTRAKIQRINAHRHRHRGKIHWYTFTKQPIYLYRGTKYTCTLDTHNQTLQRYKIINYWKQKIKNKLRKIINSSQDCK